MSNFKCHCGKSVVGYMGRFGWLCHFHVGEVLEKIAKW